MSNNPGTSLRATAFAVLVTALAARPAPAQVGHDPAHSPYRDLRASHQITFSGGDLAGGAAGISRGAGARPARDPSRDRWPGSATPCR